MTDNRARQRVLDAAAVLQGIRRTAVAELSRSRPANQAQVLVAGRDIADWMMRRSADWRHVLPTRDVTSTDQLSRSLPNNRRQIERGLQMMSVFDEHGTDPAAVRLLTQETPGVYYLAFAPMQMRLVDHREVYLHGPCDTEPDSVVSLTSTAALTAAYDYWHAVLMTARPCAGAADQRGFTNRQRQILELLCLDLTDEHIAASMQISVRTVRYKVAAVMAALGVRSRFAAGFAYAGHGVEASTSRTAI